MKEYGIPGGIRVDGENEFNFAEKFMNHMVGEQPEVKYFHVKMRV